MARPNQGRTNLEANLTQRRQGSVVRCANGGACQGEERPSPSHEGRKACGAGGTPLDLCADPVAPQRRLGGRRFGSPGVEVPTTPLAPTSSDVMGMRAYRLTRWAARRRARLTETLEPQAVPLG
jgi:hypothetical protein